MVLKKGKNMYVPPVVIEELEDIKREDEIFFGAEAFRKLVKYARVGRELRRVSSLGYDWGKKVSLPPVESYPSKNKRFKRNGGAKFGFWGF